MFLREIRGTMTLRAAGDLSGINWSRISDFERGKRSPRPEHLVALAQAYGVDRHFVLLYADLLGLPGFDLLLGGSDEESALGNLLNAASVAEKRQLVKLLASIRFMPRTGDS